MIVLDTDILSDFSLNRPTVVERMRQLPSGEVFLPIIVIEEALRGRLEYIRRAMNRPNLSLPNAYLWLERTLTLIALFGVLPYTDAAHAIFTAFGSLKLKTGTQGLRIASIALAHKAKLITRNKRDYEQVPNLNLEVWN